MTSDVDVSSPAATIASVVAPMCDPDEYADEFGEYGGLPEHSAEFHEFDGDFALSVSLTNGIEVTLHHPDGYAFGTCGWAQKQVLAADSFIISESGALAARQRIEALVEWRDEIRAAIADE